MEVKEIASQMRRDIVEMANGSKANSHFGAALSIVEILAVLYEEVMNHKPEQPSWKDRDRFFLSKGHGVLAYYAILANKAYIEREELRTFQKDFSRLISHPVKNIEIGIESTNGSLGHGLSLAVGSLLAARKKEQSYRAFVLLGNGECNEGSVWEAAMAASHFQLKNLVAIVDNNQWQSDGNSQIIMKPYNIEQMWESFGWQVILAEGHQIESLRQAFQKIEVSNKPSVIIANTVKGKGISFMENDNEWHHNHLTIEQYDLAVKELGDSDDRI